ncbi:TetR/AcrR family transcriptional regulator [Treponema sp.]|uniref:TetR/AcrR family transcriptional regulator n=1 Tax=Treponema sp. TaxID=166 RepID=UPI003F1222B5
MEKNKISTREKLIQSAFSFYDKVIFDKIPLSKIAAKVGITKPAIYKHFKSRTELENAMLDTIVSATLSEIKKYNDLPDADIIERIAIFLCKNRQYFYYIISNTVNFAIDTFFDTSWKLENSPFSQLVSPDRKIIDKEKYKRAVYTGGCIIFFHGARDFILLDRNISDNDDFAAEYAAKLSSFICNSGLRHDISSIDPLRLSQLAKECLKEIDCLEKPDRILEGISNVICKLGSCRMTVENLANELELAKSSFYTNFSSKKEMLKKLLEGEALKLINATKKNLLFARNPAECVYILMATEVEFFLQRKSVLASFRWFMFQNLCDDFYSKNSPRKVPKLIDANSDFDFFAFLANSDIITEIPDMGNPPIDMYTIFAWIYQMPIFFLLHGEMHNMASEEIHAATKDFFYYMEKGISFNEKEALKK